MTSNDTVIDSLGCAYRRGVDFLAGSNFTGSLTGSNQTTYTIVGAPPPPSKFTLKVDDTASTWTQGEKNVKDLLDYYATVGSPRDFQVDVNKVFSSYSGVKVLVSDMDKVGKSAANVLTRLKRAYPAPSTSSTQSTQSTQEAAVVDTGKSKIPTLPKWAWWAGGTVLAIGAAIGLGYYFKHQLPHF